MVESKARAAVLVVEDEPVQLMAMVAALGDAGFEVAEATGVDAAVAHLDARPEIVAMIADVDLAGEPLTGFTLAKAVAARWPEVAILIVSGLASPTEDQLPMAAQFMRKPFSDEMLVKATRRIISARGMEL
ncbi:MULTISPECIES: response regulator [unclassified Methylobacterium]|jgi:DNA-binding NtrC family response regulator|uniref:response regulator n=2 Tax=Methylobacterium TaxID=407 RepID=UPI0010DE61A5|nr:MULTISPECIES: response regulator [unclassified Methylobacterium]RYY16970.1 MAG: response regulator [Alphaproteobacteria bacterium]TXN73293.1 response regulator [Methylobacterium sp. WL6]